MADEPNMDTPDAGDLNTAARRVAAERGWAMDDGAYPIRPADMHGAADLDKAVRAVGRGDASHDAIRRHIVKRARAIGMAERIPDNWAGDGSLQGERSAMTFPEIEVRNSTLQDVDTRKRLIDLIAVPWDQEADVIWRGELWHESFERGSFDGVQDHAGRVQVNREHRKGVTVGKVVLADPTNQDGLFTRVKVYSTPNGDETLTLADEGGAFPSVGFRVKGFSDMRIDRRSNSRRIIRAFLDHLSMVEDPAYVGAEVLAVRAGQSGLTVAETPLPDTPVLSEALADGKLAEYNAYVLSRRTAE